MAEIMVSVLCAVYNQEDYVRTALESFVKQETDFAYEVIVNDDASTDGSANIIREFEQRYPDIIKGVYQTENLVSRKISPTRDVLVPLSKGKYIALCEGDDYWVDTHKLQKQLDYMQAHPDCTFCFTNGMCEEQGEITRKVIPWEKTCRVLSQEKYDLPALDALGYIPTASFFFPRTAYENMPILKKGAFRGDTYLKLCMTEQGYAAYIPDVCVVYRYTRPGSITTRWHQSVEEFAVWSERFVLLYRELDRVTDGKYHHLLEYNALWWEIKVLERKKDWKGMKDKRFRLLYKRGTARRRLRFFLLCRCSFLFQLINACRRKG